jgi:putative hydrolase of the HAD superfamily
VRTALNLDQEQFSTVAAEFWSGDVLDAALVDYLRSLRPRYRTALLSNAWDDLRHWLNHEFHIADAFDEMVFSAEVGIAKPEARIYHLALERLGVAPGEAVFVDDFPENVTVAQELGMQAILFRDSVQVRAELDQVLNP